MAYNDKDDRAGLRGYAQFIKYTHTHSIIDVVISFILDVRFVDIPAGVAQEEGHTGFQHLPPALLALIFLARRIQPFLSLVGREVEFCVLTN